VITALTIRDARTDEFTAIGLLLVEVYSGLAGLPTPDEQPQYYELLANIGRLAEKPKARLLVAVAPQSELAGAIVYFGDMAHYGSDGIATCVKNASGIRLLGVSARHRNLGAGRALTQACIELARKAGHAEVILHTTLAMQVAWRLYESLGFVRSEELDFSLQDLPVFGFRLRLN
jgi:ribosomal protein S18 acetylase RimI-like enzyme